MLAGTSDILVILRVCVGERKMARVSQNSSGGGRVICSYVGTLNFFSGASILASVASQRAARGGCLLLHAATVVWSSNRHLAPRWPHLSPPAKKGDKCSCFTRSLSARCRDSNCPGRKTPQEARATKRSHFSQMPHTEALLKKK